MIEHREQLRANAAAFAVLFTVSLYRRISLIYFPDDPFRTYILYVCYIFLIVWWGMAIHVRVTQKGMRFFLILEAVMMMTGMTIRFLQDTFWQDNILLLRASGLYIEATILPMILLGLYATLGIGQADSYKISRKWYLLLIPVILMTMLILKDERYHFVNYIIPGEPQPNLSFHPYIGAFLMSGLVGVLMILRVLLIFRKNRLPQYRKVYRWLIPLIEPLLMLLLSFEYFVVSLDLIPSLAGKEVIELYAKIYYAEALTWEIYIYLGLVPVNTGYWEIFRHATVGMQVIDTDGRAILSQSAMPVSQEQLENLRDQDHISAAPGVELHAHRFSDGLLLWNKDVSQQQTTINELNQSAETMAQEGILLEEELKTKNRETSLAAKNQIYDELTREIRGQLKMMKEIAGKHPLQDNSDERLRQLVLLGTYVKRRCNLRFIQKESGGIHEADLRLSFEDMQSAMRLMRIQSDLSWFPKQEFSSDFSVYVFDTLEYLLEYERFAAAKIGISAGSDFIEFTVTGSGSEAPVQSMPSPAGKDYGIAWQTIPDGYSVKVTEGRM